MSPLEISLALDNFFSIDISSPLVNFNPKQVPPPVPAPKLSEDFYEEKKDQAERIQVDNFKDRSMLTGEHRYYQDEGEYYFLDCYQWLQECPSSTFDLKVFGNV